MPWEKLIPHTGKGRMPPGMVSIDATRKLRVSTIHEQLGNHVELLFDPNTGRMALKPTEPTIHSYQVKQAGHSWHVCLMRFISYYELDHAIGYRYQTVQEDDLFVIDLNNPTSPIRPRGRSQKTSSQE